MNNTETYLNSISRKPLSRDDKKPVFYLVVPSSSQIPTPGREFLLTTPTEGISYVSTTLKNAGYPVEILDYRAGPPDQEGFLTDKNSVIAIATFMDSFLFMEDFISRVRKANKDIPIILGGSFVSSAPQVLMRGLEADFAVLGEGELTILELMEALAGNDKDSISKIPGICYRQNGSLVITEPRQQIRNLDSIPVPDFYLWPAVKKIPAIEKLGFSSSRGCYNNCSFCFKTLPQVRQMSPSAFGESLRATVDKHSVKFMYLNDLTFVIGRKRTEQLCLELKRSGIRWACSTRVEDIDEKLLALMKDCGCEEIWYGIESVDQQVLDTNFKRTTVEQIEKAVRMTSDAGIKVMANLIVGLLGETQESLDRMIKFVETKDVIPCSIKYLSPFPGTYVYDYARKEGLIKDEIGYFRSLTKRKVNAADDEIINCTRLPEAKLRQAFKRIREISYQRYGPLDWESV